MTTMAEWEAKFETILKPKEFSYQKNIEGYFKEHFSLFDDDAKIIAFEFELTGNKQIGYTLAAVVIYKSESELYPRFMERPVRWNPALTSQNGGHETR
jgi:hypothetical protein